MDPVHEVYAASYRRLVGRLTEITGDAVEAEDAVTEAFARATCSPDGLTDRADQPLPGLG